MAVEPRIISDEIYDNGVDRSYNEVFELICNNIHICTDNLEYVYFIDKHYVMDTTKGYRYENLTPDYEKILKSGIRSFKYTQEDTKFKQDYNNVCDCMCLLADRIVAELREKDASDSRILWFEHIKDRPVEHFKEAIQRMLFVNQLFWQTDHRLVGLGAWDSILYPYYLKDLGDGLMDKDMALSFVESLFRILHADYSYKSNALMGDTGQIFVLGRSTPEGKYICNELTYLFIEAMKNVQQTDPKCLLRVNRETPRELMSLALDSIATGLGAPLLANDDVVIPCLRDSGIDIEDACEYTTSACWEPLIGGMSSTNNNRAILNYLVPFDMLVKREKLEDIAGFDVLVEKYLIYLKQYISSIKRKLKNQRFQYNPLLSVFIRGCYENFEDVSQGGAKYNNIGITSVGMGNVVNSLFNVKKYVFERREYDLYEVKRILAMDYADNEEIRNRLSSEGLAFGKDEKPVISLVQKIMDCVSDELAKGIEGDSCYIKTGLSGSAYLDEGKKTGASFDGRHAGEPLTVHISNEENNGYTEIVNFASLLSYKNRQFNGNVVDYMVSPDFIRNNFDKYVDFLYGCIDSGFFEMQMNVVSSKILIEAKDAPDRFPDLIVRVWGFSAYFRDLPDEYKEVLIRRAIANENRTA